MNAYICGQCGHEEKAETPPLCPKCLESWGHIKSRMTEKVEEKPSALFKGLKR